MVTSASIVERKAQRVSELMQDRLGLRGRTLMRQAQRGARVMDRDLRAAALRLGKLDDLARRSKQVVAVDEYQMDQDYRLLIRKLEMMPPGAHRTDLFRAMLQSVLTSALAFILLAIGVMVWMSDVPTI